MDKEKILTNEGVKKVEKKPETEDPDITIDKVETEEIELPSKVVPNKEPLNQNIEEPRNPMKEDITKPKEEPKPSPKEKKDYIKESNEHPEAKKYGVRAMKKSTYVMMWVFAGICLLLLTTNVVWSNAKDLSPQNNFTINNNPTIETTVPTTNHNNFTIVNENQITISDEKLNNLSIQIAEKVLDELNLTNSTI